MGQCQNSEIQLNISQNDQNAQQSEQQQRLMYFGYGSNNIEQLRERCQNSNLTSVRAKVLGYRRFFCGWSQRWNGGIASIVQDSDSFVHGSFVPMTMKEIELLDVFEGCKSHNPGCQSTNTYRRELRRFNVELLQNDNDIKANVQQQIEAFVYIKNKVFWKGPPSDQYLNAIHQNSGEQTIEISNHDRTYKHQWKKQFD